MILKIFTIFILMYFVVFGLVLLTKFIVDNIQNIKKYLNNKCLELKQRPVIEKPRENKKYKYNKSLGVWEEE